LVIDDTFLVVQREAAERHCGVPSETLAGLLLKPWFAPSIVHRFHRDDFTPKPSVEVVMLRLRKRGPPLVASEDAQAYRDLVVSGFTAWRPTIGDALAQPFGQRAARRLLDTAALDPAPVAGMLVSVAQRMPDLLSAYRSGEGVDWAAYGPDMWQGQAALNRPLFLNVLGQNHLPSIPEVDAILSRPGARVADLACGGGWSSIAIARAYPGVIVDGYDLDAPTIEQASSAAASAGLADRVRFFVTDAAIASSSTYDLVTIFEALHDVPDPVGVLRAASAMLRDGAVMLVMDERVAEEFTAPGDEVERFMYGWSLTVCLPAGMAERPSAATGTVMRRATLERYAKEAGFSAVEVLPVENDFFRFYLLRP